MEGLCACEKQRDAAIAGFPGRLFLRHPGLKGDPLFDATEPPGNGPSRRRIQPVDATVWLNISAGVW